MTNGRSVLARVCVLAAASAALSLASRAGAQQLNQEQIVAGLERDGCVTLPQRKVKVCKDDYRAGGRRVEAVSIRPLDEGRHPGLLLIPGYRGTATTFILLGTIFAQEGFACLSVAQPGFGKSEGKPDYVGPETIRAMIAGFRHLQREPYVDPKRAGVFGYSRGAMAASLVAVRVGDVKAAVFGAGIYDFRKAYEEIKDDGIRANMTAEAGTTEKAFGERSSILRMKKLKCPVLILHGEDDENVPVSQAILLRDRLTELHKPFEIKLLPHAKHGFIGGELLSSTIDFLKRQLKGAPDNVKSP